MKIIERIKLQTKIRDITNKDLQIDNEIETLNKEINECYSTIGRIVVEKSIDIPDICYEKEQIIDKRRHIEDLLTEKENGKKELYELEETVRNIKGKIGCPNCGSIYEKTSDLIFCSKCGAKLIQDENV